MTLREFRKRLRATPRTWHLYRGSLRAAGSHCPLSKVFGLGSSVTVPYEEIPELSPRLRDDIMAAADLPSVRGRRATLRAQLLADCGLTESK